jgi:DNA-binding transcriptional MerR regulator
MRTSEVARAAGVSADTIRLYERRGLVPRPRRSVSGYRQYPPETVPRVQLVRRALAIGFTLEELRVILAARDRGEAPCRAVRALAAEKLEALNDQIEGLAALRDRNDRRARGLGRAHGAHASWPASRSPHGPRGARARGCPVAFQQGVDSAAPS